MAKPLTQVCGRRSPLGGFEQTPMKYSQAKEKFDQWDLEQKDFTLQLRKDLDQQSGEVRALVGYLSDEAKATGQVTLSMARTYNEGLRRNQVHTKKFPADKPFTVSSKAARRIMNHDAYSYLFEEVDDGAEELLQPSQAALLKPGQYDLLEKILKNQEAQAAKIASLEAENTALKALVGAPESSPEAEETTTSDTTPPPPSPATAGAPPKPGGKKTTTTTAPANTAPAAGG